MRFDGYKAGDFHDEMFDRHGRVRKEARLLLETIESLEDGELQRCQREAERLLLTSMAFRRGSEFFLST